MLCSAAAIELPLAGADLRTEAFDAWNTGYVDAWHLGRSYRGSSLYGTRRQTSLGVSSSCDRRSVLHDPAARNLLRRRDYREWSHPALLRDRGDRDTEARTPASRCARQAFQLGDEGAKGVLNRRRRREAARHAAAIFPAKLLRTSCVVIRATWLS